MLSNELSRPHISILGCRGIPASHGGFETFAEQLSLYLSERGWEVSVYCQDGDADSRAVVEDRWRGIRRFRIGARDGRSLGSLGFDIRSMLHACSRPGVLLVLGYNTGFLAILPRLIGRAVVINMDGIEWRRSKWSPGVKLWFWLNERIAALAGSALVADHPEIATHLASRVSEGKIVTISYGAESPACPSPEPLRAFGLEPDRYAITICRIEPENSVLDIVRAFTAVRRAGAHLVVLGTFDPSNSYHAAVRAAAGPNVLFPGAIYDREILDSLRVHARIYCHGHTVGGTNPSLVEALAAGCAVIAHDNPFNRWTAGERQIYFPDLAGCIAAFERAFSDDSHITLAREGARLRHAAEFTLKPILARYEVLIERFLRVPRLRTVQNLKAP